MSQKISKNSLHALCMLIILACTLPARADHGLAAGEYEATYKHLLEQRQRLQDDRAATLSNLNRCDSWLKQVNIALTNSSPMLNRQRLLSTKSYLLNIKDKLQKDLDFQEISLSNVEKDLAWVEGEMRHFAFMR